MTYFRLFIIIFNILYNFKSVLSYTLQNKLPLGKLALDIGCIEYDSTNKQYLIASWYDSTILSFTEASINNAMYDTNNDSQWHTTFNNFQLNTWRDPVPTGSGAAETPFNTTNAMWNMSTWRPAGMAISSNKLYVADFYGGRISKFDIATRKYESSMLITNSANMPANIDALCVDSYYYTTLYAIDYGYKSGYETVYIIMTAQSQWPSSHLFYTRNVTESDNGYIIRPNGCVVVNGDLDGDRKIYTVDFNGDTTQGRGFAHQTDSGSNEWTVTNDILPKTASGLFYIEEINTFYATDYANGTLMKMENGIDNKFMVVYEGMDSPVGMAYNNEMKVLAIPEFNTGFVNFIKLNDALFTTTTAYFTTTEAVTTEEDVVSTKKPDDITIDAAGTVGFIVTCIISLIMVLVV